MKVISNVPLSSAPEIRLLPECLHCNIEPLPSLIELRVLYNVEYMKTEDIVKSFFRPSLTAHECSESHTSLRCGGCPMVPVSALGSALAKNHRLRGLVVVVWSLSCV